ncbi:MAG: hypothetical protein GY898_11235 [Proteobacteria bacterium]|nr:hypothetical protein [Pseudomonadota bacterium]
MPLELPAGILTEERFDGLKHVSKAALLHMVEKGEVPAFIGKSMTAEQAVEYLKAWLDRNKLTLAEGGFDFLAALARKIAVGEEEEPIEEFEAALASLTDEQIVALNKLEAKAVTALKKDVIDRRRELLADILATGKELLRGAIATGLHALMDEIRAGGLPFGGGPGPNGGGDGGGVP